MFILLFAIPSCQDHDSNEIPLLPPIQYDKGTYGYDVSFMQENGKLVVELHDSAGLAKILLSPEFQGRVITSSAAGDSGASFGWINYGLIAGKKFIPHFNPFGGEERFWLGPEGGQYALYFKQGDSFNFRHWQVPPIIDSLPFELDSSNASRAIFSKHGRLVNYAGTKFDLDITRTVRILDQTALGKKLGIAIPSGLSQVAYETENQIRNSGSNAWKKETGLLSIWLLGMMTPSDHTIVFIPFKTGANSRELITDNYFGKIPAERLIIKDSILYFKCDGKARGKIGLSPLIAGRMAASFNFDNNTLSIVVFHADLKGMYVNSKWEIQEFPYRGDAVNSYNDGPLADGTQLGPFYEIESSSPAKELNPGEIQTYSQVTCHIQGDYAKLKNMVMQLFGIDLDDVKKM